MLVIGEICTPVPQKNASSEMYSSVRSMRRISTGIFSSFAIRSTLLRTMPSRMLSDAGAVMSVRPVGVLLMEDEAGGDEKIIAVPSSKLTQRYDKVRNYSDLPDITLQQIQHFFEHYKDLEKGKWVKVLRWGGAEDAHRLILEGIERAKKK